MSLLLHRSSFLDAQSFAASLKDREREREIEREREREREGERVKNGNVD